MRLPAGNHAARARRDTLRADDRPSSSRSSRPSFPSVVTGASFLDTLSSPTTLSSPGGRRACAHRASLGRRCGAGSQLRAARQPPWRGIGCAGRGVALRGRRRSTPRERRRRRSGADPPPPGLHATSATLRASVGQCSPPAAPSWESVQACSSSPALPGARSPSEHGYLPIRVRDRSGLLRDLPEQVIVFHDHTDAIMVLPPGFEVLASSDVCAVQAFADPARRCGARSSIPRSRARNIPPERAF